jgi:hypothetical protein
MLYKTVEKINDSFNELKKLGLITDFNYIIGDKVEKGFFEIFLVLNIIKLNRDYFIKIKKIIIT